VLRRRFVQSEIAESVLEAFRGAALASCVMTDDVIHVCRSDEVYHRYLRGWSHSITEHHDVRTAVAWSEDPEAAIMLVGIGDAASADAVVEALAPHGPNVDIISFDTAPVRA
jgi:hypothetical protein